MGGRTPLRAMGCLPLLAATLFTAPGAHAGRFYRCEAPDGSTTYQQTPCTGGAETVKEIRAGGSRADRTTADGAAAPLKPYGGEGAPTNTFGKQARFVQAIASLGGIRTTITEHYMVQGEWPETLGDIGYSADAMTSPEIAGVRLGGGGRIIAELAPYFGDGKRLALTPRWVMDGSQIEWQCAANFPERLLRRFASVDCDAREIR